MDSRMQLQQLPFLLRYITTYPGMEFFLRMKGIKVRTVSDARDSWARYSKGNVFMIQLNRALLVFSCKEILILS